MDEGKRERREGGKLTKKGQEKRTYLNRLSRGGG